MGVDRICLAGVLSPKQPFGSSISYAKRYSVCKLSENKEWQLRAEYPAIEFERGNEMTFDFHYHIQS
jgi:hypothetical protein